MFSNSIFTNFYNLINLGKLWGKKNTEYKKKILPKGYFTLFTNNSFTPVFFGKNY